MIKDLNTEDASARRSLDEIILCNLALATRLTPYSLLQVVFDTYPHKFVREWFNAALARLIYFKAVRCNRNNQLIITSEFEKFVGEQGPDVCLDSALLAKWNNLYWHQATVYHEHITDAQFQRAKQRHESRKDFKKNRSKALTSLFGALLFVVSAVVCITGAAVIQGNDGDPMVYNSLGIAFFFCLVLSVVFLAKDYTAIASWEADRKKIKFDKSDIHKEKCELDFATIKKRLLNQKYKIHTKNGTEFYYKTKNSKPPDGGEMSRPSPYSLVFFHEDKELAWAITESINAASVNNMPIAQKKHRFVLVFVSKSQVTEADINLMKRYVSYDMVGEMPLVFTPILVPMLYDKQNKVLYFKSRKIPWSWGSTFNHVLKFTDKLIFPHKYTS